MIAEHRYRADNSENPVLARLHQAVVRPQVPLARFERAALNLGGSCSIRLSYRGANQIIARTSGPGKTRVGGQGNRTWS
jgi:hypothetical protein